MNCTAHDNRSQGWARHWTGILPLSELRPMHQGSPVSAAPKPPFLWGPTSRWPRLSLPLPFPSASSCTLPPSHWAVLRQDTPLIGRKEVVASSRALDIGPTPSVCSQPHLTRPPPCSQEKARAPGLAFKAPHGPAPHRAHHPRVLLTALPSSWPLLLPDVV